MGELLPPFELHEEEKLPRDLQLENNIRKIKSLTTDQRRTLMLESVYPGIRQRLERAFELIGSEEAEGGEEMLQNLAEELKDNKHFSA
jgi:hypothetical protein